MYLWTHAVVENIYRGTDWILIERCDRTAAFIRVYSEATRLIHVFYTRPPRRFAQGVLLCFNILDVRCIALVCGKDLFGTNHRPHMITRALCYDCVHKADA